MSFSKILSAQNHLLKAHLISVETDISRGSLHSFTIVGLPDKAIEEARDRVSAAIKNSGFKSPKQTNAKIVISLAPAHIKKEGPIFDISIALGYLLAAGDIEFDPRSKMFVGELALNGDVRPVRGVLSYARIASDNNVAELYVPLENAAEAALIQNVAVYGVKSLTELIEHLDIKNIQRVLLRPYEAIDPATLYYSDKADVHDTFDDVVGQETAKRGLIIAASGGHNIALYGPPGTGKTMLARALLSILPPLSYTEILEVTEIYSAAGYLEGNIIVRPPVRSPHHTSSYVSLIGGGSNLRPGEITLAHRGVLFLDEFPEFDRKVIESLRQPLEERQVSVSRARGNVKFPADFILVAALNPCPCGNKGIEGRECICLPKYKAHYNRKISGPIIDRIDMWIEVSKIDHSKLMHKKSSTNETEHARRVVESARIVQKSRLGVADISDYLNSHISARNIREITLLSKGAEESLNKAAEIYNLSGRRYHRTIKLARTIADIDASKTIEIPHIMEALQYRQKQF